MAYSISASCIEFQNKAASGFLLMPGSKGKQLVYNKIMSGATIYGSEKDFHNKNMWCLSLYR